MPEVNFGVQNLSKSFSLSSRNDNTYTKFRCRGVFPKHKFVELCIAGTQICPRQDSDNLIMMKYF